MGPTTRPVLNCFGRVEDCTNNVQEAFNGVLNRLVKIYLLGGHGGQAPPGPFAPSEPSPPGVLGGGRFGRCKRKSMSSFFMKLKQ